MTHSDRDLIPVTLEPATVRPEARRVDIARMTRLRWPFMLVVFAVLGIMGAAGVWLRFPPQYTATADLRFASSAPRSMRAQGDSYESLPYEKFLNTQVSLITGNGLLSTVLDKPAVRALPIIAGQADPLEFLKKQIKADIEHDSEMIRISCKLPNREAADLLVQSTLTVFLDYARNEEAHAGGERLRALRTEEAARQSELDEQLKHMNELQQGLGMPVAAASDLGTKDVATYRDLEAKAEDDEAREANRQAQLEIETARLEELTGQYQKTPSKAISDFSIEEKVLADACVAAARKDAMDADAKLAQVKNRYADNSPQFQVERENANFVGAKKSQTEAELRGKILANTLSSHREELDTTRKLAEGAKDRKGRFAALIQEQQERAMGVSKTLAALDESKQRLEETRAALRNVRDEITSVGLDSSTPARVELVSPTVVPLAPEHGKQYQMFLMIVMMAFGVALILAWLAERADRRVRTVSDLAAWSGHPVVAVLPDAASEGVPLLKGPAGARQMASLTADYPDTDLANEIRKIMARITFCDPDTVEARSCLITSPGPGEGKTSVACNLAIALADTNRRVLLIDTSPGGDLERRLGLKTGPGLSEALIREEPLLKLIRPTSFRGLYAIGPGLQPNRLASVIAAPRMFGIIKECEKHFDQVLIDTPASLEVSNARLLASMVEGVVLVTGVSTSTGDRIREVVEDMEQAGGRILGVVMNRPPSTRAERAKAKAAIKQPRAKVERPPELTMIAGKDLKEIEFTSLENEEEAAAGAGRT